MFGRRFFGARYYAPSYFGDGGTSVVVPPPVEEEQLGQFAEYPLRPWTPRVRRRPPVFARPVELYPDAVSGISAATVAIDVIAWTNPGAAAVRFTVGLRISNAVPVTGTAESGFSLYALLDTFNLSALRARVMGLEADAREREDLELLGLV